jgi:glutamate-1-semialdehyde 2,1-aminomutase
MTSEQLFEKARNLIPGGVNSPVRAAKHVGGSPLFIKTASGSQIIDVDDNKYIDFCQSWGPLILGHSHPRVVQEVTESIRDGLSYGACHKREIELAELVLSAFNNFERIRFVNSGTEAVMTALRIARGVTKRDYILKFEGGYHGHFDGLLVKAGSGLATQGLADSEGIPERIASTTLVAKFDDEENVERLFKKYGNQIAAVIIEPLPANNGLLIQRKEFLQYLRDITNKYGSLLIFDEVISGFRLHFGGYYQFINIKPDLVTLGKIIGGGMPVGAIVGMASKMEVLSPVGNVYQAGTLSGNPISLASGIATLNLQKSKAVYKKLENLGNYFKKLLDQSYIDYVNVQKVGSIVWLYLEKGELPRRPDLIKSEAMERFKKIYGELLEDGYYLPPSPFEVLFFSNAHSKEQIKGLAGSIVKNLKMTEG